MTREEAVKVIDGRFEIMDYCESAKLEEALDIAIKALEQPERKKGKWDFMGWQMFQCSECKHTFTQDFLEGWREYTYESHFPPFCPNCGSYNRGEQDEAE